MTNYPYSAYGPNPYSGNVNADNGWGPYKWRAGVPGNLLTSFDVPAAGGTAHLTFRSELVELVRLSFQIAAKHGYPIYAKRNGEVWGPWSYENRAISGSNTASNHSRGRAWDINAPNNPYTSPLVSDMPPAMVRDFEAVGWAWGGRYQGRKDAMHFEYGYSPADVPRHVAKAKEILGGGVVITPPTNPTEPTTDEDAWLTVGAKEDIITELRYGFDKIMDGKGGEPPDHNIRQVKELLVQVRADIAGLRKALFQPGFDTEGGEHSARAEVGWATDKVIIPKLDDILRALGETPAPPPLPATYTVKPGDTLGAIAKANGVTWQDLAAWNGISNPDNISEGQVLRLTAP